MIGKWFSSTTNSWRKLVFLPFQICINSFAAQNECQELNQSIYQNNGSLKGSVEAFVDILFSRVFSESLFSAKLNSKIFFILAIAGIFGFNFQRKNYKQINFSFPDDDAWRSHRAFPPRIKVHCCLMNKHGFNEHVVYHHIKCMRASKQILTFITWNILFEELNCSRRINTGEKRYIGTCMMQVVCQNFVSFAFFFNYR